jgi:hypothetical protein
MKRQMIDKKHANDAVLSSLCFFKKKSKNFGHFFCEATGSVEVNELY